MQQNCNHVLMLLQAILCFPCNQFGHQENSNGDEIMNALKHVRPGNGFKPKSIMFDKVSHIIISKSNNKNRSLQS